MDATLATDLEESPVQGVCKVKEIRVEKIQRTENVQLEGKTFKMGQFNKLKNIFEKKCSKDDIGITLQPKTEQLAANPTNRIGAEKEENLQTAQQGAGTREPAIGGELGQVQPSANRNARK